MAILAPYFHLFTLPTVIAPLGLALFISFFQMKQDNKNTILKVPSFKRLLQTGIAVLIGIGLWLIPLLCSLAEIKDKMNKGHLVFDSFLSMLSLFSGTGNYFLVGVCVILFLYGFICLYKKELFLFFIICTILFLQSLAVMITMPICIGQGIVLARYCISFLLFWLLIVAVGISDLLYSFHSKWQSKKRLALAVSVVTLFVSMLFLKGPLIEAYYYPNNFTNHMTFQYDYRKKVFASPDLTKPVMRFYDSLKSQPGVQAIVEYPYIFPTCIYSWAFNPFHFYQHVHGKKVIMGEDPAVFFSLWDNNIRFRSLVNIANPDSWRGKADYLIIHRNLSQEIITIFDEQGDTFAKNKQIFFTARYHMRIFNLILKLKSLYGQPVYEDEFITVFKNSYR